MRRRAAAYPVEVYNIRLAAEQLAITAEDDLVRERADIADIQRRGCGDAEPLALADGIVYHALVLTQNIAGLVHKIPALRSAPGVLFNDPGIVPVRDKADILTVGLCRERGVDPAAHRDQCFFHWRDL